MSTVLVVDDHPDILELLQVILTIEGYNVVTARDGAEAVAAVEQHHPKAVVMDIWMPRLDGISATKLIRALPQQEATPVIAYTADPGSLGIHAPLFSRVCVKPCAPSVLLHHLADAIRLASCPAGNA